MLDLFIGNPSLLPLRILMLYVFMYGFSERVRSATYSSLKFVFKVAQSLIFGVWWVIKYPVILMTIVGMKVIFPLMFIVYSISFIIVGIPVFLYTLYTIVIGFIKFFLFGVV